MKNTLLIAFLSMICLTFSNTQAHAQQAYDSLCESYKTYYTLEDALKDPLAVQKLDLSMQKLTVLPEEIMQFKNLVCLDLAFNRIGILPTSFANLTNLKVLNLTGTRYMSKVPSILAQMPNLLVVDLREHPEWTAAKFDEAIKLLPHVTIIK
ncbi:leucine-rich repeat domain-containing protein [uncultured Cytophaga sp.]|uniref:leucine-rich repeat domain-containing protein n=1 Tax=uncultured Cytophaga sp. TaxID=160238 RepID=UPI00260600B0|nr:leucine-rich repeat domain-containing protein [uncultured Cytophaga sp.]